MRAAVIVVVLTLASPGSSVAQSVSGQRATGPTGPAWDALRAENYGLAAEAFEDALVRRPSDPFLHYGLGVAINALGRPEDARRPLARAIELEPRLTAASALLGRIVYDAGDLDGAIAIYERALEHGRGYPEIQAQLERWRSEASVHAGFEEKRAGRFNLLFEGPEERQLADRVHRTLESAYWQIGRRLNGYPGDAIQVLLYTEQHFRDITRSPAWSAGVYDGRIRIAVGDALRTPAALDRVVVHELAHAMVQQIAPRGVPTWLHEGLAVHFEGGDDRWIDEVLGGAGRLAPLSSLDGGFGRLTEDVATLAYAESAAATAVLINRLGPNLAAFLQSLGSVSSFDDAAAVFGFTTADLDSSVRARSRR
jgi:tetratricopeptide (TPR) repeat protein